MSDNVFAEFPCGSDGRDRVSINLTEIASYRGHVVTSYSYVDYTLVLLKNGVEHDCRISKADFERKVQAAWSEFKGVTQ